MYTIKTRKYLFDIKPPFLFQRYYDELRSNFSHLAVPFVYVTVTATGERRWRTDANGSGAVGVEAVSLTT